eukprot:TRINITY_DN136910_c0_g1_i1.p1 TRINITY_DN136910_c0_g1~~TRINITY_DN136910_c0_g1_i1.p1  ORF type:complete len:417 (-),score=29.46 TRINITY_DN136910_c0_g1_i1:26-1252(-)
MTTTIRPLNIITYIAILGEANSGKSQLLYRYTTGRFSPCSFRVSTESIIHGKHCKITIWEKEYIEAIRTLNPTFRFLPLGVVLVFDVTNKASFDSLDELQEYAKKNFDKDAQVMVLGNCCDKDKERAIEFEEAADKANSYGAAYMEVSAKNGHNVKEAFEALVEGMFKDEDEVLARPAKKKKVENQAMQKFTLFIRYALQPFRSTSFYIIPHSKNIRTPTQFQYKYYQYMSHLYIEMVDSERLLLSVIGKPRVVVDLTSRFLSRSLSNLTVTDILMAKVLGKCCQLEMWNSSFLEAFSDLFLSYIFDFDGAMLVFDLTDKSTFYAVDELYSYLKITLDKGKRLLLVGTSCENVKDRAVSFEEAANKATELNAMYLEASAETGFNVKEAFEVLVKDVIQDLTSQFKINY